MLGTDEIYMNMALQLAKIAEEENEVPIGCVIVGGGNLLAKGYNQTERLKDPTAHAEMLALTAATHAIGGKYLDDCTLYVTLEPCPMCAAALNWAHLGRIVYAASDSKNGYSIYRPQLLHPKTEVEHGVLQKECSEMLKTFFQKRREK